MFRVFWIFLIVGLIVSINPCIAANFDVLPDNNSQDSASQEGGEVVDNNTYSDKDNSSTVESTNTSAENTTNNTYNIFYNNPEWYTTGNNASKLLNNNNSNNYYSEYEIYDKGFFDKHPWMYGVIAIGTVIVIWATYKLGYKYIIAKYTITKEWPFIKPKAGENTSIPIIYTNPQYEEIFGQHIS